MNTLIAYAVALGPYFGFALLLGFLIPAVLVSGKFKLWGVPFLVLALSLIPIGHGDNVYNSSGSLFRQVSWTLVFVLAAFIAVPKNLRTFDWIRQAIPLTYALLIVLALVSCSWSDNPEVSFKRALQLCGVVLIALAICNHAASRIPFRTLAICVALAGVGGVFSLASFSHAFDLDGNFRGFSFTKNVWGQLCFLGIVFSLYAFYSSKYRAIWGVILIMFIFQLGLTRSVTSIAASIIAVSVFYFFMVQSSRTFTRIVIAAVFIALLALTFGLLLFGFGVLDFYKLEQVVFSASGKDLTLTGRTNLWNAVLLETAQRPWLGYGYGGFWLGLDGPSWKIFTQFPWRPAQAHNGYLDVLNELGVLGIALTLSTLGAHAAGIVKARRLHPGDLEIALHAALFVSILLFNITESNILRGTNLLWIILTTSIFRLYYLERIAMSSEHVPRPAYFSRVSAPVRV